MIYIYIDYILFLFGVKWVHCIPNNKQPSIVTLFFPLFCKQKSKKSEHLTRKVSIITPRTVPPQFRKTEIKPTNHYDNRLIGGIAANGEPCGSRDRTEGGHFQATVGGEDRIEEWWQLFGWSLSDYCASGTERAWGWGKQ